MKYTDIAKDILNNLGGSENIQKATHCATRLRVNIKDKAKMDKEALERLKDIQSVVVIGNQAQVVIGPQVVDVYEEFMKFLGNISDTEEESKDGNVFSRLIETFSSLMTPILYTLASSGILKGVLSLLLKIEILSADDSIYTILNAAGDTIFYFMPVFLAITASKRFKTNLYISLTLAGAIMHPNIVALGGQTVNLFGLNVAVNSFSSTLFPIIFAVYLQSKLEKIINKTLPSSIRNFLTPMFCFVVIVPLTIIAFGPASAFISKIISDIYTSIYNFNVAIAGAFIGFFFQVITMFGLQWGLLPITFTNLDQFGFDTFTAFVAPTIVAQGGAAFGVYLRTKDKNLKTLASSAALISFFGISEPSIYGINIKYKRPFLIASLVSAISAAFIGLFGIHVSTFSIPSVFSLPIFMDNNFSIFLLLYFGAFVIAAILTYLFGYKDKQVKGEMVYAPISGEVVSLDEVNDTVFSNGLIGDGFAIKPNADFVVTPFDGTVTMLFETNHAISLRDNNGREILIHIGLDTVNLQGEHFKPFVKQGDIVKQGDRLISFEREEIERKGYDTTVVVAYPNTKKGEIIYGQNQIQMSGK